MRVANHHSAAELRQFIRREQRAPIVRRLQAVLGALEGETSKNLVPRVQLSERVIREWVNITLVSLPPRSPELNPVENLWHYLRSHHWSNRTYKNLDAVEEAAEQGWRKVCLRPELIRTLCACHYIPSSC